MPHLTGDLSTFDLRQILTLLSQSRKTGELRVAGSVQEGRVFFDAGLLLYATTRSGPDAVHEVDVLLESHESSSSTGDPGPGSMATELGEQIIDVVFRLMQLEAGGFMFDEEAPVAPFTGAGGTFTVEEILRGVDVRVEQWRKIHEVIPSRETPYTLAAELPAGMLSVTLDAPTFRYASALGSGASVDQVAERLNVPPLTAANQIAALIQQGLLAGERVPARPAAATQVPQDPAAPAGPVAVHSEPVPAVAHTMPDLTMQRALTTEPEAAPRVPEPYPAQTTVSPEAQAARHAAHVAASPTLPSLLQSQAVPSPHPPADPYQGAGLPRVSPAQQPVTLSSKDLSRDEINEKIRNFSRGIY